MKYQKLNAGELGNHTITKLFVSIRYGIRELEVQVTFMSSNLRQVGGASPCIVVRISEFNNYSMLPNLDKHKFNRIRHQVQNQGTGLCYLILQEQFSDHINMEFQK